MGISKNLTLKKENKNGGNSQNPGFAQHLLNFWLCEASAVFKDLSRKKSKQVFRDTPIIIKAGDV